MHWDRRRGRGRAFRPRPRSGDCHTGRRPQRGGHRRLRRRDRHRPLGDAGRASRSRRPQGLGLQGGALWGDVDHETQAHGLATTGGIVSHTGVAGLTLGGGVGWLMRKHGLTIDNLLAVDVVTADGELLRASEDEHPDLFWALRGGGGNFGLVTSFVFRLHPVRNVICGPTAWPVSATADVLSWFRDFLPAQDDDLYGFFAVMTVPPGDPFPEA